MLHIFFPEFLPRQKRGTVMVVVTLCGAFGAVLAAGLAWLLLAQFGWRWFVGACSLPAWLVLIILIFAHDETPRFLFSSGRYQSGMEILLKIAQQNQKTLPEGLTLHLI